MKLAVSCGCNSNSGCGGQHQDRQNVPWWQRKGERKTGCRAHRNDDESELEDEVALDSEEVTDVLEDPEQLSEVCSVDGELNGLLWIAKAMALCHASVLPKYFSWKLALT